MWSSTIYQKTFFPYMGNCMHKHIHMYTHTISALLSGPPRQKMSSGITITSLLVFLMGHFLYFLPVWGNPPFAASCLLLLLHISLYFKNLESSSLRVNHLCCFPSICCREKTKGIVREERKGFPEYLSVYCAIQHNIYNIQYMMLVPMTWKETLCALL